MSLATYKKRSGTSDRGKDYEWLLCAFYSLKFSTSRDVIDFEMFTNNDFFGDFDDISLRVKFADGSVQIFLLQLKHSEKTKTLSLSSLTSQSGEVTLFKYRKSYENVISLENFKFILYMNKTANFKDKTKLELGSEEIHIRQHSCVAGGLLNTNHNRKCSVFKFDSASNQKGDFFSNFYLYVNQQNDTNLKQSISDLLKAEIHADIYTSFVEFMRVWWAGNFKLSKYDVVAKLAELVLSPAIKTLSGKESNGKTKLIAEAILKFDVTIVDGESGEKITKIWKVEDINLKQVSLCALKYGLTTKGIRNMEELSLEKQAKVLWFLDQVPLIVEVDDSRKDQFVSIMSLIEGCKQKKKVIVISGQSLERDLCNSTRKVFKDLSDIPEVATLHMTIVKTFTCSLQGKQPITLENLGALNSQIASVFRVSQLLQIATSDSFNIGESLEPLPPSYIPRSFFKILFNYSVIDGLDAKIAVSCKGQKDSVQSKISKRMVKISSNLTENFSKRYIYASDFEFPRELMDENLKYKKVFYHFRVVDSQTLQWLDSRYSIDDLHKFRRFKNDQIFDESEIDDHFHSKIKVLTSHTGNGKTSLLSRIKNQSPPNWLVIKLNLKEHGSFFLISNQESKVWDYVTNFTAKSRGYNAFELEMTQKFEKEKTILLWDAFDELPKDSRKNFVRCVKHLFKMGMTQWITSKNNLQKPLENAFDVFAMTMLPFCQKDQICYLRNRCGVNEITLTENFFKNMQILDDQEYLGVPLQLYIVTDIFNKDPTLLEKIYTLTDMFGAFIEGKYTHYLRKSSNNDLEFLGRLIEHGKEHRLDQYKIASLKTHLPELSRKLNLKNNTKFLDDIQSGDFLGLIIKSDPDSSGFVFEYHIIGEYLSALYLSENLELGLDQYIFEHRHRNIRFLFDLLMAGNQTTFVGILYKKFEDIVNWEVRDKAGRNPLHLLCSYGERHPLLKTQNSPGKSVVEADQGELVQADSETMKQAVLDLRQKCDPFQKDMLFNWTCIDYADRSFSLGLIEILGIEQDQILPNLHNYKDLATVLYYSTKLNYQNLFNFVANQVPFVEDVGGGNLLHVAVEYEREIFLRWLLSQDIYQKSVNKLNANGWTPIHIASFNGNLTLLKFLREKGGTFLLKDPSVMSLATTHGYKNIVEFLLECNCSPNEFYHCNYFTQSLPLAITHGYIDIVDFLITNGARFAGIGKNHMNALHLALESQQFEIAEMLLKKGIKINDVDDKGQNSYHHAAINNHTAVVSFLLEKGADHQVLDTKHRYPLHWAAQSGSSEVVEILLRDGAEIDAPDEDQSTPLHLAVLSGQASVVTLLVNAGANPNAPNNYKKTPVHLAARNDLPEIIAILHNHGGDLQTKDTLYGRQPLHYAAWYGHEDCVKTLIERGVKIDATCNFEYTPLHLAVEADSVECCRLLLEAGAPVDVMNRNSTTPLNMVESHAVFMQLIQFYPLPLISAASQDNFESIFELVALGHDINRCDENGTTPLHVAVSNVHSLNMIRVVVANGADVNRRDESGYTALHQALQSRFPNKAAIEALLEGEGEKEVNGRTLKGLTPLHVAAQGGALLLYLRDDYKELFVDLVQLLIDRGAKCDATDEDGFTPLHYAAQSGSVNIVKVLLSKNSHVNDRNKQGRTLLHMASIKGCLQVVEFLLKNGASGQIQDYDGDTPLDDALSAEKPAVFKVLLSHTSDFDVGKTNRRQRTVLHMAAKEGSLDLVKFFMSKVSLDVVDIDGNTPLEDALFNRHYRVFKILLKHSNFDVNKMNKRQKRYPLHAVSCTGTEDLVKLFLKRGAKVDVVDDDGNTPFHNAANYKHKNVFLMLLKHNKQALNMRNKKGQTVLHLVVELYLDSWIGLLLDNGADVDAVDDNGNTPFDIRFHEGSFSCEELLFKMKHFDVNKRSRRFGTTLLHMAVESYDGSMDTVQWLIERGASINAQDKSGETPLYLASWRKPALARLLLGKFKSIDLDLKTCRGDTVLTAARNSFELVHDLVKLGASTNSRSRWGKTPLHSALDAENAKLFKFLWERTSQADILSMIKENARTPLHIAAANGDVELTRLLLEQGLKINEVDQSLNTPLDDAVTKGHLKVVELLLEKDSGLVVNKSDCRGRTLLHVAAEKGKFDLVKLLVERGAKVELCDSYGQTPAEVALEKEHKDIYEFLKEQNTKDLQEDSITSNV